MTVSPECDVCANAHMSTGTGVCVCVCVWCVHWYVFVCMFWKAMSCPLYIVNRLFKVKFRILATGLSKQLVLHCLCSQLITVMH